jgi:hypothetical protein
MEQPVDRIGSLLNGYARGLLDDLKMTGEVPHVAATVQHGEGWGALAFVFPLTPGENIPDLSDCDRACLRLLLDRKGDPVSAARARKELEQKQFGIFGLATVKRSLADLHLRWKLASNSRRKKRGYYVAEATPLMVRLAQGLRTSA